MVSNITLSLHFMKHNSFIEWSINNKARLVHLVPKSHSSFFDSSKHNSFYAQTPGHSACELPYYSCFDAPRQKIVSVVRFSYKIVSFLSVNLV